MRTIGVVAAKAESRRLPNKNLLEVDGLPLYAKACFELVDASLRQHVGDGIEEIHLLTDIKPLHKSLTGTTRLVNVHERPTWTTDESYPLQDVYKWFLYDQDIRQGTLVALMPTNPMIDFEDVANGLDVFNSNPEMKILRSYGYDHKENGLYIADIEYILHNTYMYDVHTGALRVEGIEIHTEEEFNQIKETMNETD